MSAALSRADVERAAARIAGAVVHTPTVRSRTLSTITGADVFVKFENLQFTASYKERGALNRLLQLPPDTTGVVTASAGNFAQGVAHHAARIGLPAVIVMPVVTPSVKLQGTRQLGAEVVQFGADYEGARDHAATIAAERGFTLLSPFNDLDVIAGQGTVAIEMMADWPDLEVIVAPVGGGGLLAGMCVATAGSGVEMIGVQSEAFPAVHDALAGTAGANAGFTIAEGIAVGRPGDHALAIIRALASDVTLVSEALIEQAVALYLEVEKTVAEGAGAVSLAELLARPERYAGRTVGIVLSGGNIDLRQLASVTLRGLVSSGRLTRLLIEVPDDPGSLGAITTTVGELGGNIVDVVHQRLNLTVHTRLTEVELLVETTDRRHLDSLVAGLAVAGYRVRVAD